MKKPTDIELLEEIRQRFEFNHNALSDMRNMTRKLEVMNDKLKESEALKGQFLSNIRNEINNPLSAIMGLAGQLLERSCDPDLCQKIIRMIYAEAFSLDYQLQNIFLAAELEAGEAVPAYAMVDIGNVLHGCLDKLACRIAEKELRVEKTIPDELLFLTDAQKFGNILINLLGNAVEFNVRGGHVFVDIEATQGELTLTVRDDGQGIAAADQKTIFDRFRQLETGSTKGHRGHGLGLSVCWSLAELLNGTLELESLPGKGSRFVLTLPKPDVEVAAHAKDDNFFLFDTSEDEVESF